MKIFILDEIVVKPGRAAAFRQIYRADYMPGAQRRGMTLENTWQSPPGQDFDELEITLYYLWSVDDVQGWWAMRMSRTPDGADERFDKLAFWQKVDHLSVSRKRTLLTEQPEG